MDIIKPRVKKLTDYLAEAAEQERRQKVDGWIAVLTAAEASAIEARNSERTYLVSYRVKGPDSVSKGRGSFRRDALIELMQSLKPRERHQSTSTWIFALHIPCADEVLRLLSAPLDTVAGMDFISVAEVTGNRTKAGGARLKS